MQPLRGALIGFGFIAENGHLPAYVASRATERPFDIVAVADGCAARREKAARALPNARIYESHEALLAAETANLDFVDIATPPCDHAKIAIAALDRGLHVLCEKPLATRPRDARAMISHARAARRVLFPCHNYKHAPVIRAVRQILNEDAIGSVHMVTLDTFRTTHALGVSEWRRDWRREKRFSGGGIAMDHGPHTFYLCFEWLRAAPRAVTASMATRGRFDTEDTFACTVDFGEGIAMARLAWHAGVRKVIYTLHGDRGAIRVEDDEIELTVKDPRGPRVTHHSVGSDWKDAGHPVWFRNMHERFLAAIDQGDYVGQDALEAAACIDLISAAYVSARNGGREVVLDKAAHEEVAAVEPPRLDAGSAQ